MSVEKELRATLKAGFALRWKIGLGGGKAVARATVAPFVLEIEHSDRGSIDWITIESRPGGGVRVWRSANEMGVPLDVVVQGMRLELSQIRDRLGHCLRLNSPCQEN